MAQPPPAQPVLEATADHVAGPLPGEHATLAGIATEHLPPTTAAPPVLQAGATLTTAPPLPDPVLQQPPPNQTTAPVAMIAAPTAYMGTNSHRLIIRLARQQRQQQLQTAAQTATNRPGRHILTPLRQQQQLLFAAPTAPTTADPLLPQGLPVNDSALFGAGGLAATTATALAGIAPAGPLNATGGAPAGHLMGMPTGPVPTTVAAPVNAFAAHNAFAPPPFGIIAPPLDAVAAPHAFGPVLVTRISLVEVGLRFHEAQVIFRLKREAAIQQVVDGSLTSEKSLLRLATIDLMAAWEGSFNDLLGAFFQRWGSEPVRRAGRNASGDKWDEYLSKTPGFNNVVFTVQRLGLLNSHYNTQWHVK